MKKKNLILEKDMVCRHTKILKKKDLKIELMLELKKQILKEKEGQVIIEEN